MSEEIVEADIDYNGYNFKSVGIRPKGNSSLMHVANSDSTRFSYKVDFDYYANDQNLYGITKINLNNIFGDPSMMYEYLGYEMMDELGADASRTNYVALYINDEYVGLYLAVEQVNESFLKEHYGNGTGELYKPEMARGADLKYISDNSDDYTALIPKNKSVYNNNDIIKFMKVIEEGGDLESVLNVDSFLKYLAMSTITVHLDAYQGGMYHNYYLYNNNGVFEWIAWDLNMIFNGFTMGVTEEQAIQFLIDEPVKGEMAKYPLIEAIFKNEEYVEQYHEYIQILIDGYLSEDRFTNKVLKTYQMINSYVKTDPTSFFTYKEFEDALFNDTENSLSLLNFVKNRNENVQKQLDGTIPSTNNGQGNEGESGLGGKGGFGGLGGQNGKGGRPENIEETIPVNGQNGMNRPKEEGKEDSKNAIIGGLPPGVNIEDMPEELRSYIENGEMPPMDMMMEFMENLPGGFPGMGGEGSIKMVNPIELAINLALTLLGVIVMLIFMRIMKKKY
nr:CotH kinase family protein [Oceanirhabdus seepicola]